MNKSDQINELAKALCAFQSEIKGAVANSTNPFFNSKYADIASVLTAVRAPLAKVGLSVVQLTKDSVNGPIIETVLLHASGQWISGELLIKPTKNDAQGQGAGITYARRYSLTALLGVPEIDDDGNTAANLPKVGHSEEKLKQRTGTISDAQGKRLFAMTRKNNWSTEQVKSFLKSKFKIDSSKDIRWQDYEQICKTIELKTFDDAMGNGGSN